MDRYLGAHYLWAPLSEQPKPDHGIWGVCIRVVCSPYSILGQVTPLISFFSQSAAPNTCMAEITCYGQAISSTQSLRFI